MKRRERSHKIGSNLHFENAVSLGLPWALASKTQSPPYLYFSGFELPFFYVSASYLVVERLVEPRVCEETALAAMAFRDIPALGYKVQRRMDRKTPPSSVPILGGGT